MKVFLSWSGEQSRAVAEALREWLPFVNPEIEPWLSGSDIDPGERWSADIARELDTTDLGIVCVTRSNQTAAWLNFEAGALAKRLDAGRVIPLAIGIKQSDVKQPLGQFQVIEMSQAGILEVVKLLNGFCNRQLPDVTKACEQWWPELEAALATIPHARYTSAPVRDPNDLLDEILTTVRNLHTRLTEAPVPTHYAVVTSMPDRDEVPGRDPSDPEYEARLRAATNLRTKIRNRGFFGTAASRVALEDPPSYGFALRTSRQTKSWARLDVCLLKRALACNSSVVKPRTG